LAAENRRDLYDGGSVAGRCALQAASALLFMEFPLMHSTIHPFDQAIALRQQEHGLLAGHTSAHYWNAISPFGGATAATVLQAMLQHSERLGDPLNLTVNFAGPIRQGEFAVRVAPVRTGRSTQHWQLWLHQEGDPAPALTGTAVFAKRRPTWSAIENAMPPMPPRESLRHFPPPAQVPFLDRYDMRYPEGQPFGDGGHSRTRCWIADLPPRPLDFASVTAYCDSFIPRLFLRRLGPSPISTITMSINFHVDAATLERLDADAALGAARANAFCDGYYDQEGQLWAPDGTLLATTHQLVWFRDQDKE
jgi:acyl-CoA thioesterase